MYNREYTPERITELKPNEVFVFGSNLSGYHGGGAANIALEKFGAVWGQGVGLQGQSYAIPTMQGGVETIKPYVDEFIKFAKAHPELKFLVTRIGCGIAGFKDSEIAPCSIMPSMSRTSSCSKSLMTSCRKSITASSSHSTGTQTAQIGDKLIGCWFLPALYRHKQVS